MISVHKINLRKRQNPSGTGSNALQCCPIVFKHEYYKQLSSNIRQEQGYFISILHSPPSLTPNCALAYRAHAMFQMTFSFSIGSFRNTHHVAWWRSVARHLGYETHPRQLSQQQLLFCKTSACNNVRQNYNILKIAFDRSRLSFPMLLLHTIPDERVVPPPFYFPKYIFALGLLKRDSRRISRASISSALTSDSSLSSSMACARACAEDRSKPLNTLSKNTLSKKWIFWLCFQLFLISIFGCVNCRRHRARRKIYNHHRGGGGGGRGKTLRVRSKNVF